MAKNIYDSKTPGWQRVVIWIIAIALAGGTLVGFFFMVFATKNPNVDPNVIAQNQQQEEYQKQLEEYQKQQAERQKNLRPLEGFEGRVGEFDAASVTELKVETLKEGEGATVGEGATISANYTGWTPDGQIFDSTKSEGEDASPASFSLSGVIEGWTKGLTGRRVGGIYELTIPSDLAYGATGSSDGSIAPDTPLRFVVQIIDATN